MNALWYEEAQTSKVESGLLPTVLANEGGD
jgi:hypothetical protein